MRISENTTYNNFLYNLGNSQSSLQATMQQLSSQQQVSKPSDNPLAASQIMALSSSLTQNKTYANTIKDAINLSQTQDSALSGLSDQMLRIRTLVQASANGAYGPDELKSNKTELSSVMASVVDSLNADYGGRYVFAGTKIDKPPFELVKATADDAANNVQAGDIIGIKYNGSTTNQTRSISSGVSIDLATNGANIVGGTTQGGAGTQLGDYFANVIKTLNTGINKPDQLAAAQSSLGGELLGQTSNFSDKVVNVRTTIGAVVNRLNIASAQNTSQNLNLTTMKSNVQDVDMAKAYMEYQKDQTTYQSTLAMGTKIMNTTILNYM